MVLALSRRLTIIGALAVGVLGAAGCGSHPGSEADPTTVPTTVPPSTTPSTSEATPSSTAPGATTTTLPPMTATGPAAALFGRALADAGAEHWVHGVATTGPGAAGGAATTFVSDDGPGEGTQDITVGQVTGDIRVVGTRTYIHGAPAALVELFDVPVAVATRLAATWIALRPGDSDYASVTAGVTISSFLSETAFSGTVTEAPATLGGKKATVIRGRLASAAGTGQGSLYVTDTARPLPLQWRITQTDGTTTTTTTTTTTFSHWGRAVHVAVPAGAVPLPPTPGTTITVGIGRPAGLTAGRAAGPRLKGPDARPQPGPHARRQRQTPATWRRVA